MTDATRFARMGGVCLFALAALWSGTANANPANPFSFLFPQTQPVAVEPQQVAPAPAPDMTDPNADAQLPERLQRRIVDYPTTQPAGTIVVDTPHTYLYYVLGSGKAIRYGIGVGRDGFTWSGVKSIERKAEWPNWIPPEDMLQRQPYLPRFMAGGPGNPLGARAMYIAGTVYRIHGTNAPDTIGKHVSSGCIRMLNADVIDLYNRVQIGARVVVLPMTGRPIARTNTVPKPPRGVHAQVLPRPAATEVSSVRSFAPMQITPAAAAWQRIGANVR